MILVLVLFLIFGVTSLFTYIVLLQYKYKYCSDWYRFFLLFLVYMRALCVYCVCIVKTKKTDGTKARRWTNKPHTSGSSYYIVDDSNLAKVKVERRLVELFPIVVALVLYKKYGPMVHDQWNYLLIIYAFSDWIIEKYHSR